MIIEINDYTDFLLSEYQLILDLDNSMEYFLNNYDFIETETFLNVKNFLDNASLDDQLGASKKILGDILNTIDNYENSLNVNSALVFINQWNNYFNLSMKLFGLQNSDNNEKANDIFKSFFQILFQHANISKEVFVNGVKQIIEKIESLEIDNENILLQSMYNIFLRILLTKNAVVFNKELTQKMVNIISPEITRKNIIHRIFYNNW